jgi:MFS family permease
LLDLLFLTAIAVSWNYWSLLVAVLLIQVSSNISHGPLQGLIPDLAPDEQRGMSSAVKAIFELLPLILVGITIAPLVGGGKLNAAIFATGAALLVTMLLTMILVREEPLGEKVTAPIGPPMLRVMGMLAGIGLGAVAGILGGGLLGILAGLGAWLITDAQTALAVGVGLGGAAAMVIAVVAGVWSGALATLGNEARQRASFTWWVVNRLMFLAAVTSIQSFAPYFLMYAFQIDRQSAAELTGKLITMVGIFTLLTAFPSGWLADRIGPTRLVAISGLLATVGSGLLLGTIWVPNLNLIYVAGAIIGLATGLFMTSNWALGTALAPAQEAGRYLGVSNLAGAGAGMIGAGIGGPLADYLNGFHPGLGYFAIFSAYTLLFLLSVVSLVGVRRARDEI